MQQIQWDNRVCTPRGDHFECRIVPSEQTWGRVVKQEPTFQEAAQTFFMDNQVVFLVALVVLWAFICLIARQFSEKKLPSLADGIWEQHQYEDNFNHGKEDEDDKNG